MFLYNSNNTYYIDMNLPLELDIVVIEAESAFV